MNPYAPPNARVSDPPHDGRPSLWVTQLLALFFAFLSIFSLQSLLFRPTPLSIAVSIAVACLCGLASLGLWRARPWSRWVVHLISALVCVFVAWVALGGWPYASTTRSFAALIPFSLLLLFGVAAPVYVERIFRK
jgi:hypothetical protein